MKHLKGVVKDHIPFLMPGRNVVQTDLRVVSTDPKILKHRCERHAQYLLHYYHIAGLMFALFGFFPELKLRLSNRKLQELSVVLKPVSHLHLCLHGRNRSSLLSGWPWMQHHFTCTVWMCCPISLRTQSTYSKLRPILFSSPATLTDLVEFERLFC